MEERFPDDFITWHHKTPMGIKVDEVFGMDSKHGKTWLELARQIYCDQSDNYYRVIEHFPNGAPFLEGFPARISITHTDHFFAVASLPKTPDIQLETFNTRTAMGIDAEHFDRLQVLKVRDKFLSTQEKELCNDNDVRSNIIAWTSKEALYKAALTPGLDFKSQIVIQKLPVIDSAGSGKGGIEYGNAIIIFPEDTLQTPQEMKLYSYESYECCVTIAFSNKCAKFGSH